VAWYNAPVGVWEGSAMLRVMVDRGTTKAPPGDVVGFPVGLCDGMVGPASELVGPALELVGPALELVGDVWPVDGVEAGGGRTTTGTVAFLLVAVVPGCNGPRVVEFRREVVVMPPVPVTPVRLETEPRGKTPRSMGIGTGAGEAWTNEKEKA
jgi:hypothetical protein